MDGVPDYISNGEIPSSIKPTLFSMFVVVIAGGAWQRTTSWQTAWQTAWQEAVVVVSPLLIQFDFNDDNWVREPVVVVVSSLL